MDVVTISAGNNVCTLAPATGGSIASWHVGDQAMLRTAVNDDPLAMASFPLVPYSNRIGGASFDWAGRRITIAKNYPPETHAIHGVGWMRPWSVESHGAGAIMMRLSHAGDDHWPWPFEAQQRITVRAQEMQIDLSVVNLAAHAVPLAFGHHPYFEQAEASLRFEAAKVWMAGKDDLPTVAQDVSGLFDFGSTERVEGRSIDNCYTGITGIAQIAWADRLTALEIISTLPAAVVYIPLGGKAFCFEPVPHVNNALNMMGEMPAIPVIKANGAFETSILFRAVPKT